MTDDGVIYNCAQGDESFEIGYQSLRVSGDYTKMPGTYKETKTGWVFVPDDTDKVEQNDE